ncbi:hypothetical protein Droror1_Dr00023098 [Drosera rotundifolia]
MCWTLELHDSFVEAVNQLGGGDSTYSLQPYYCARCIKRFCENHLVFILFFHFFCDRGYSKSFCENQLMNVEGLTIYHVKSHLQRIQRRGAPLHKFHLWTLKRVWISLKP